MPSTSISYSFIEMFIFHEDTFPFLSYSLPGSLSFPLPLPICDSSVTPGSNPALCSSSHHSFFLASLMLFLSKFCFPLSAIVRLFFLLYPSSTTCLAHPTASPTSRLASRLCDQLLADRVRTHFSAFTSGFFYLVASFTSGLLHFPSWCLFPS